jgi:hypothetical protein
MTAALDRAVANALGLKSVNNCEKWSRTMAERTYTADEVDAMIARAVIAAKPPKREWVGLTDEQIADYLGDEYHAMTTSELRFFRLGEAAAKEKNT